MRLMRDMAMETWQIFDILSVSTIAVFGDQTRLYFPQVDARPEYGVYHSPE